MYFAISPILFFFSGVPFPSSNASSKIILTNNKPKNYFYGLEINCVIDILSVSSQQIIGDSQCQWLHCNHD